MTYYLIYNGLKINQLKLIGHNHVWLESNLCKFTLQLKLVSSIYFNPMVQSMFMNFFFFMGLKLFFDRYDLKTHCVMYLEVK